MTSIIPITTPLGGAVTQAIRAGDIAALRRLLDEHPGLAASGIGGSPGGRGCTDEVRSLLHVATDWPGHFPNGPAIVSALLAAGADVHARFVGSHTETPLHWAASSDDVAIVDTLLDAGADIDAPGAVIGGGSPLADAVAFGQWQAARRLVERGAQVNLWQAAALGVMDRVEALTAADPPPDRDAITQAFWLACHGGQRASAAHLLAHGADPNWIGYEGLTALDAARRSNAGDDLIQWLTSIGAHSSGDRA